MDAPVRRKDLFRLAAAGLGVAAAGSLPPVRVARASVPRPAGDDLGYAQFGVVAELVCASFYHRALSEGRGWTHGERRRLTLAREGDTHHLRRLNALNGEDAVQRDDYEIVFPAGTFASRARTLAQGERLERMVIGVYIDCVTNTVDRGRRELLGRMIAADARHLAGLEELGRGTAASAGLPGIEFLENASSELDAHLRRATFPKGSG